MGGGAKPLSVKNPGGTPVRCFVAPCLMPSFHSTRIFEPLIPSSLSFPHALTKVLPAQVARAAQSCATSQLVRRAEHTPRQAIVYREAFVTVLYIAPEVIFGLRVAKQGFVATTSRDRVSGDTIKMSFLPYSRPWRSRTASSGLICCTDRERAHPLCNLPIRSAPIHPGLAKLCVFVIGHLIVDSSMIVSWRLPPPS